MQMLVNPRRKSSLFLLPLILVPFLCLAVPDVIVGGIRSGGGNRYLTPSYLGLEIAVASWLAVGLSESKVLRRFIMQGALIAILAMGIVSGVIVGRADTWWHKTNGH